MAIDSTNKVAIDKYVLDAKQKGYSNADITKGLVEGGLTKKEATQAVSAIPTPNLTAGRGKEIQDYVNAQRAKGFDDQQIRQSLLNSGIDAAAIDQVLGNKKKSFFANPFFIGLLSLLLLLIIVLAGFFISAGVDEVVPTEPLPREEIIIPEEPVDVGCLSNVDCAIGLDCVDGNCIDSGPAPEPQCGDGVCNIGESGSCLQDCPCITDSDCDVGQFCNVNNECQATSSGGGGGGGGDGSPPPADGGGTTVADECSNDLDCTDGFYCASGSCQSTICSNGVDDDADGNIDAWGACDVGGVITSCSELGYTDAVTCETECEGVTADVCTFDSDCASGLSCVSGICTEPYCTDRACESSIPVTCQGDSDGDDPLIYGFAGGRQSEPVHDDVCLSPNLLSEAYCDAGVVHQKLYNCLDGCVNGACTTGNYDTNLCLSDDNDGGDDPLVEGAALLSGSVGDDIHDTCATASGGGPEDFLIESYCGASGEVLTTTYECLPPTVAAVTSLGGTYINPDVECFGDQNIQSEATFACTVALPTCADGVDNDLDGTVDLADPDCTDWVDDEGVVAVPSVQQVTCGASLELTQGDVFEYEGQTLLIDDVDDSGSEVQIEVDGQLDGFQDGDIKTLEGIEIQILEINPPDDVSIRITCPADPSICSDGTDCFPFLCDPIADSCYTSCTDDSLCATDSRGTDTVGCNTFFQLCQSCTDSDGGIDFLVQGVSTTELGVARDEICEPDGITMYEYNCVSGDILDQFVDCEAEYGPGSICDQGACVPAGGPIPAPAQTRQGFGQWLQNFFSFLTVVEK